MLLSRQRSAKASAGEIIISAIIGITFISLGIYGFLEKEIFLGGRHGRVIHFTGEQALIAGMWLVFSGLLFTAIPIRAYQRFIIAFFSITAIALAAVSIFLVYT